MTADRHDRLHQLRENEIDLMTELVDLVEETLPGWERFHVVQEMLRETRREIAALVALDIFEEFPDDR